jgi:hypothetical protein
MIHLLLATPVTLSPERIAQVRAALDRAWSECLDELLAEIDASDDTSDLIAA